VTIVPSRAASRARRPRRGRVVVRWLIGVAILALVFGIGVAVGQALEDRPRADPPITRVSTIQPWTRTAP
jgi:hypothetical protein